MTRLPDETTILWFLHMLESHGLGQQRLATENVKLIDHVLIDRGLMRKKSTLVDFTLISAPSSTKNDKGERDPEMQQTKEGNQKHFGIKTPLVWVLNWGWCKQSQPLRQTRTT